MPRREDIPLINLIPADFDPETIKKIPIIGDLYGAGNAIIEFYESGCRPTWDVYVKLLWPATGSLVMALLGFGLSDVLIGYFRPGGLRRIGRRNVQTPKGRKGKRLGIGRYFNWIKIPEIGNEFGKILPGSELIRGIPVGTPEVWFWGGINVIERGLWYWLIADITEDFIIHWSTAILESKACEDPLSIHCTWETGPQFLGPPGEWHDVGYPYQVGECKGFPPGGLPGLVEKGIPRIAASVEGHPWWPWPATGLELAIQEYHNPGYFYAHSSSGPLELYEEATARIFAELPGPGYWQVKARTSGGLFVVTGGLLQMDIRFPPTL